MIDAKLEASLANALTQKWEVEATGLVVSHVDISSIRPNFSNPACTEQDLNWFKDGRPVTSDAVKAQTFKIKLGSDMSQDAKAKLDLALAKIGTEFHTDFAKSGSDEQHQELTATNAYVGGRGTSLVATKCELKQPSAVKDGESVSLCDGKYSVKITTSSGSNRYTLSITPSSGDTAQFDEELGVQKARPLGDLRIASAMVERSGAAVTLRRFSVLFVGAGG